MYSYTVAQVGTFHWRCTSGNLPYIYTVQAQFILGHIQTSKKCMWFYLHTRFDHHLPHDYTLYYIQMMQFCCRFLSATKNCAAKTACASYGTTAICDKTTCGPRPHCRNHVRTPPSLRLVLTETSLMCKSVFK